VVELPIFTSGRRPVLPPIRLVEDVGVFLSVNLGFRDFVLLEAIKVFEKQQPGGLFGVVKFGRTAGLFAEHVVDIAESLFKHLWRPDSWLIRIILS
jgi:hypothetical protein